MERHNNSSSRPSTTAASDAAFVADLLQWFDSARRVLPWREAYSPYSVWISEIMLQQTQMERGVEYFKRWMRLFPTIDSVALASEDDILAAWEGLGYYSRARNLHAAAKHIVNHHHGIFPSTPEAIRALPGVGEYTAGAIASIAFNLPEPAVDANVLRIFSRLLDLDTPVTGRKCKGTITTRVRSLLVLDQPRLLNQAFMELGALVCGKTAKCDLCPVAAPCLARQNDTVQLRPAGKVKTEYQTHETVAGIIIHDDHLLARKRPSGGLWPGLWEFPGGVIAESESPEAALARLFQADFGFALPLECELGIVRHGYTNNRVIMHGFLCLGREAAFSHLPDEYAWIARESIASYAFASGHKKLLQRLGWK